MAIWRKGPEGLPGRRHCLIVVRNVLTKEVKYFVANRVPGELGITLRGLLRVAGPRQGRGPGPGRAQADEFAAREPIVFFGHGSSGRKYQPRRENSRADARYRQPFLTPSCKAHFTHPISFHCNGLKW